MFDFSIWSYLGLTSWIGVTVFLFVDEILRYRYKPHLWARRHEGMISLTDNQRYWCYVFWPVILAVLLLLCVVMVLARIYEHFSDRKYDRKYPNIVNLASVQFPTNIKGNVWAVDVNLKAHTVVAGSDGKYLPARGTGLASIRQRVRCAWLVFTGKADALVWPGDQ